MEKNQPESHTEEMDQFLGKPPGWIINWGMTVIFGCMVVFILLSGFIRYSNTVQASVKLNPLNGEDVFDKSNLKSKTPDNDQTAKIDPSFFLAGCVIHARYSAEIKTGQPITFTGNRHVEKENCYLEGRILNITKLSGTDSLKLEIRLSSQTNSAHCNAYSLINESGRLKIATKNSVLNKILSNVWSSLHY